MATTTNYSWTTPDDTDLVKDGAAAIRTLGTAIDTTVFTNAGDAISKSLVDAAGDLIYATADNTVARLALGTAGQALVVNSGATAPEWATPGGFAWTSAASANFPTGTDTVTISSLTGKSYFIVINGVTFGGNDRVAVRFNGDTANNYRNVNGTASSRIPLNNTETTTTPHNYCAYIPMANTSAALKGVLPGGTPAAAAAIGGSYKSTSAITSITLLTFSSQNFTGGSYEIWSVQ